MYPMKQNPFSSGSPFLDSIKKRTEKMENKNHLQDKVVLDKVEQIKLFKSSWLDQIIQFYQLDQPSTGLIKYFTTCPGGGGVGCVRWN